MTLRTLFVLMLAIASGSAAAFGVYRFYQTTEQQKQQVVVAEHETVPIVVATIDIPFVGTTLSKESVKIKEWPKGYEPAGAIQNVDDVIGQTIHVPLRKDEPILVGKFGTGRGMASLVETGFRAFTIHTPSSTAGVAGFVLPGDHVDVLLTRSGDAATGGSVTTTLLQNVTVLASDQMINAPEGNTVRGLKSVTLSVSPEEGKQLTLAQSGGSLTLMLRNKMDMELVNSKPITWRDIQYSQQYSEEQQASLIAGLGDILTDLAKSGAEALTAMNASAERAEARRIAMEEQQRKDAEALVPQPELPPPTPTPLQIQTIRGTSSGLVVIQR